MFHFKSPKEWGPPKRSPILGLLVLIEPELFDGNSELVWKVGEFVAEILSAAGLPDVLGTVAVAISNDEVVRYFVWAAHYAVGDVGIENALHFRRS